MLSTSDFFSRSFGRRTAGALTVLLLSGLFAAGGTPAQAQASLVTVASFNGRDGEEPHAGVTFDSQGNLFGTTYEGGENEVGTVYEIAKGSTTITDVAAFDQSNGDDLEAGVTFDLQGNLFGITAGGGTNTEGTVFEIVKGSTTITDIPTSNPDNLLQPQGGLTLDTQGNLFGTTYGGGAKDKGTVFEIAKGSTRLETLASFSGTDGENPCGGVTFDRQGNLFGTTRTGGTKNLGTVFEIAQGSTRIKTVDFFDSRNGSYPQAGVTFDSQGNLFGTTLAGGTDDKGTVFGIAKGTTAITNLVSFNGTEGDSPDAGVTLDRQDNLFGTTTGGGAHSRGMVYEIAKDSTHLKILASFNGANGSDPEGAVAFDSSGNLFGTTAKGGANDAGTVFEIAAPGLSSAAALTPAQASPAQQVSLITVDFFTEADTGISSDPGPHARVIFDRSGNLFGTTHAGGDTNESGTVFKITKGTTRLKTLASFKGTNGDNPDAGVTLNSSGNLFGTTFSGGANDAGTVFEIVQGSRHIKTLASFAFGNNPDAGVTLDGSGNLFGTTYTGGVRHDGTVYEIAKGSTRIKTLAYFNRADIFGPPGGARSAGSGPDADMIFDNQGNLFGTTGMGGSDDVGTLFEIAKGSTYIKTLVSFNPKNGSTPSGVIFDRQGNLFGTAYEGGADNDGTVFEIAKGSTAIRVIAFFNGANGKSPSGVTFDRQGNLFGTTLAGGTDDKGTVFEIAKGSTAITNLVSFTGANGSTPSGVTFDRQGNLFGTTQSGGAGGRGTVFEIAGASLRPAAPKPSRKAALPLRG